MNKIELKFKSRAAIDCDTYFLLSKKDAVDFIIECREENVELLGIDSFYKIDNETIQPNLDNSIDFSTNPNIQNVYEKAIEFVRSRNQNLFFEIVC